MPFVKLVEFLMLGCRGQSQLVEEAIQHVTNVSAVIQ